MVVGKVTSPTGTAQNRYVYYQGPDEIRVVACGTGMPIARRAQAAAALVVELGNRDKFIVDIGSGSMTNIQALMNPAILRINQLVQTYIWRKFHTLERNEGACLC